MRCVYRNIDKTKKITVEMDEERAPAMIFLRSEPSTSEGEWYFYLSPLTPVKNAPKPTFPRKDAS